MKNGVRWGLTTVAGMIAAGIAGHYLPADYAAGTIAFLMVIFGIFGTMAIQEAP